MKRLATSFAVAALMAAGLAMAQSSPPPSQQSTYPSQSPPHSSSYPSSNTTGSSSSSTSTTHKSHKQQMKDCMDEQKANNPNESHADATKYCKNQMENAPHQ